MTGTTFDVEVIAAGEKRVFAFPDRAVIFRRNDFGDCAYIIKSGEVEIREKGHAVETMEPGEIFGEVALIDNDARTASAVAVGDVELIPIDRSMFEVLLRDDPDFSLTVMRLMTRRLRAAMRLLEVFIDEPPAKPESSREPSRASA